MLRNTVLTLVLLFPAADLLHAQTPNPPVYTLHPTVTEVNLDLTVTDSQGHPIQGLTAADLRIEEDGTPQTLRSFELHTAASAPAPPVAPPLPANTFTNYTPTPNATSSFILLLDSLNTPLRAQAYAYDQALHFIQRLPPNTNLAIFNLNSRMELIQGFTTDQKLLLAAIHSKRAQPRISALLNSDPGSGRAIALEPEKEIYRQEYLAAGFATLNRYLANFPGRKNLLWLTVDLPGNHAKGPPQSAPVGSIGGADVANPALPDQTPPPALNTPSSDNIPRDDPNNPTLRNTPTTPVGQAYAFRDDLSLATGALTLSRVAIYPIDARGLMGPFDLAENPDYQSQHSAMDEVAQATGGRAIFNSNRLDLAMTDILAEGATFYTLTYSPTNKQTHGEFRHIAVRFHNDYALHPLLTTAGKPPSGPLRLTYRPGYQAAPADNERTRQTTTTTNATTSGNFTPTPDTPDPNGHLTLHHLPRESLQLSMTVGQLPPTEVIFSASVKPQPGAFQLGKGSYLPPGDYMRDHWKYQPYQNYDVLFATDAHSLTLPRSPDGLHHGKVEFVAVVYNDKGDVVNTFIDIVSLDLKESTYQALLRTGIGNHHQLAIPVKGDYTLRLGIRDTNSDHIGALEIPLTALHETP